MNAVEALIFDEREFSVSKDQQVLSLNPLSFKLLHTLAQQPEQLVSVSELTAAVWPKQIVSPEALKQRVFVLRKALQQSSLSGLTIQAVRGEGYRLLIAPSDVETAPAADIDPDATSAAPVTSWRNRVRQKPLPFAAAALLLAALVIAAMLLWPHKPEAISSNRIALWSNIPPEQMPSSALSIYQNWHSLLNQAAAAGDIQLILSRQRADTPLPLQARKDRVALISYVDIVVVNTSTVNSAVNTSAINNSAVNSRAMLRLSIIEPTTATVLRSDSIDATSAQALTQLLASHLQGIKQLTASGKLYLSKEQREQPLHPIWPALRALANP